MYGLRGIIFKGLLEICCGSFEDVKPPGKMVQTG